MNSQSEEAGSVHGEAYGLTAGQMKALELVAKGFRRKRIAEFMNLSVHTVNSHMEKVFKKLDVHTAAEAVAKGAREGIIPLAQDEGA